MHTSDHILLALISKFDRCARDGRANPKVELSLCIGGTIIVGDLISAVEFANESHSVMKELLKTYDQVIDDAARDLNTTSKDIASSFSEFIHLRRTGPPIEFWRIRISSVDGFHISDSSVSYTDDT